MAFNNDEIGSVATGLNTQRASDVMAYSPNNTLTPPKSDSDGLLETSTNIFIYANGNIVGMIQSFTVNESRTVNKLQALGYEGVVQAVPANTNGGTLQVSRMALYGANLWRALGLTIDGSARSMVGARVHGSGLSIDGDTYIGDSVTPGSNFIASNQVFRTLRDQRVPLEIRYQRPFTASANQFYEEFYVDCWVQDYSVSYAVGTITVTEQATLTYGDVY